MQFNSVPNCFDGTADAALLSTFPLLPQPIHSELHPLNAGERRMVMGCNGVFIQAKTHTLDLSMKVSESPSQLPYGEVEEKINLTHGRIDRELIEQFFLDAVKACPNEDGVLIYWDKQKECYALSSRSVQSGIGHVRIPCQEIDEQFVLLDIHSHGEFESYFSSTDDKSETYGVHISTVLGDCQSTESITIKTRLCVDGRFFTLSKAPWNRLFI